MRFSNARFPTAFVLGAATAFFFDPRTGTRRRHVFRDRSLRAVRRFGRFLWRKARFFSGRARGVAAEARTAIVPPEVTTDDATVRQRILSDALRVASGWTSELEVDVENGVATLRGAVPSQTLADDLVARVREVPGVQKVTPELAVRGAGAELDQGI